jgi:hypothetical protein
VALKENNPGGGGEGSDLSDTVFDSPPEDNKEEEEEDYNKGEEGGAPDKGEEVPDNKSMTSEAPDEKSMTSEELENVCAGGHDEVKPEIKIPINRKKGPFFKLNRMPSSESTKNHCEGKVRQEGLSRCIAVKWPTTGFF